MKDYAEKKRIISLEKIKTIMYQILKGIEYLHSRKVLHRDLKPHNILIENELYLRIADFGLSRVFNVPLRPYTKEVLTLWYRAPELIMGMNEYSSGLDMWSVGCIFAELILGQPIFGGNCEVEQLFKIFQVFGTPNNTTLPEFTRFPYNNIEFPIFEPLGLEKVFENCTEINYLALDLMERMFQINPVKRITAKEALTHQFFYDTQVPHIINNYPNY
jgi:serine/threonine protein kinase